MTAPSGTVTFDEPDGGYPYGAMVTATIAGVSNNTTPATRTFEGTLTDDTTGETGQLSGQYSVNVPNPLKSAQTGGDGQWTEEGPASQTGADYTDSYTSSAA